jgi:hypothetical protein
MSEFALVSGDMQAASAAVDDAAGEARGADGSAALASVAAALPGSTTSEVVPELADAWESGVRTWVQHVQRVADEIERLRQDAGTTDYSAAELILNGGPR